MDLNRLYTGCIAINLEGVSRIYQYYCLMIWVSKVPFCHPFMITLITRGKTRLNADEMPDPKPAARCALKPVVQSVRKL